MSTKTAALEYVKTIGIVNNGFNGRGFANPYDIAIGRDDKIFVLNRCDPARAAAIRVGICTLDDDYLGEFGYGYGDGDGQFIWPVSMAFDSQEQLYVTDEYSNRITIFDTEGKYLAKWGVEGSGPGEVSGPAGIAIDAEDNVYIVDQHNNRVQKFSLDGTFQNQWGKAGEKEGQFNLPWGVAVDAKGDVYVADWRNDRIQKFSPDGEFIATYGDSGTGEGQFYRPSGIAVDSDGYMYVADWGNERVQMLGPDGSFLQLLKGEATVSKWAEDFFASNPDEWSDRQKSDLVPDLPDHLSTPWHVSSQTEPYFWGPVSVTLDDHNRLYVSETNRHRFQVYQRT